MRRGERRRRGSYRTVVRVRTAPTRRGRTARDHCRRSGTLAASGVPPAVRTSRTRRGGGRSVGADRATDRASAFVERPTDTRRVL
ncbi:hypothetical protein GZL_03541 [Streptomyces sp. 769]|nr:hypothetical protein GZL_03541 [Streptomyces sp. 769]